MKKIFLTLLALLSFVVCNAQLKTHSNYDVNGDGSVNITDVTAVVNKVLGKATDEQTVAESKSIAAWILKLENLLDIKPDPRSSLDKRMAAIEKKLQSVTDYTGHAYVDLGLPSGLKWATCNVGATTPEGYGDYFAWGETEPYYTEGHSQDNPCSNWKTNKTGYNWSSYKWCNGSSSSHTKYCTSSSYGTVDNTTVLDLEDDAAHANWGGSWRMPTKEELDELCTKCTCIKGSQNGVYGYTVVGPNGNSLFLPAAGYRGEHGLDLADSFGYYWSSSLNTSDSDGAYRLQFYSNGFGMDSSGRFYGHSVRPVCP